MYYRFWLGERNIMLFYLHHSQTQVHFTNKQYCSLCIFEWNSSFKSKAHLCQPDFIFITGKNIHICNINIIILVYSFDHFFLEQIFSGSLPQHFPVFLTHQFKSFNTSFYLKTHSRKVILNILEKSNIVTVLTVHICYDPLH